MGLNPLEDSLRRG